ncbi:MAG: Holliday junction branch migration DNA helicase RuvB [Parachlamydiaceae bacterium]|nr:Holliday junction branch migration DNA helicase RuvB [Parachlamydiaceae bacterium]
MSKSFVESSIAKEDPIFEIPLRPQSLTDFIGQDQIRDRLEVLIGAAKQRGESLGHCLFSGPPGLGKTTLANILSKAMGTNLILTSGPVIEKPGDLAGILTSLKTGDVLFIDEIHRLNRAIEEYLYQAMEDFALDLMIDSGPNARSIQVKLNRFTLAGATTRLGLLSEPLRSRFAFTCRLDYYDSSILEQILKRTGRILNLHIDNEAIKEVATRSRGTPRIANHLLRWVRDFAQMRANSKIDRNVAQQALAMLSIDEKGLDEMDKKMMSIMIDHYNGGPVGLNTIAVSIGEEPTTIEEVYEPFLIMQGFLKRTPRGREVTSLGYKHMGRSVPNQN